MKPEDLYKAVLLDHLKHPRHKGSVLHPTHRGQGQIPSCGDEIVVSLRIGQEEILEQVGFEGQGCAISMASASMMAAALTGQDRVSALGCCQAVLDALHGRGHWQETWGDLSALRSVSSFPARIKCAELPWTAIRTLLVAVNK